MKSLATAFAFALILTTCGTGSARAQSAGSLADWLNDYELYVAEYQTNWYTVVTWDDGTVTEYWSYSQESAQSWAIWLYLRIVEVHDIEIVSRVELSEWEYVDTFGTYSAALAEAIGWEADGFETDIRAIRVNDVTPSRHQSLQTYESLSTRALSPSSGTLLTK
jgi:hypothetical protein